MTTDIYDIRNWDGSTFVSIFMGFLVLYFIISNLRADEKVKRIAYLREAVEVL